MPDDPDSYRTVPIVRHEEGARTRADDAVAREEPLEIRVEGRPIALVMRTPGHDRELVAGFLASEGVIGAPGDLFEISECPSQDGETGPGNAVDVLLAGEGKERFDPSSLTRHVFTSSSCGICGKATLDAVFTDFAPVVGNWSVTGELVRSLPDRLRNHQETFALTGGLHASALFDRSGELLVLHEDVGRHNALDKVLGHALLKGMLPLSDHLLMLSGRVSFELMQKALAGGIPLVAAISAPSSLAVDFAQRSAQTLIGFVRGNRMNVYAGGERIAGPDPTS